MAAIRILITPGHTPGTISVVFPVFERGRRHMAVLLGGVGPRGGLPETRAAVAGMEHAYDVAKSMGVDVELQTHTIFEDPTAMQFILDAPTRKPGQPNTYVIGPQRIQNYLRMIATCWKARVAIMEKAAPAARP